jgi:CubicO group peptidase (beta-lactamase class C family)
VSGIDAWPAAFRPFREELACRLSERPNLGAQVYVSRDGACLIDAAIGYARPGVAMTPDSVLYLSCAAKPLIAAAVCRLVDEGALSFGDRVADHLPGFAAGGKQGITVEDVLSHAGGFRTFGGPGPYAERFQDVLERVLSTELEEGWIPGTDQGYHQETAWYVLAALLQSRQPGGDYAEIVRDRICAPLGMASTRLTMSSGVYATVSGRLAVPSYADRRGLHRMPYLVTRVACATRVPPFGAYGPMSELARFYEQALARLRGTESSFPLSRSMTREMVASVRGPCLDRTWGYACDYGRGVFRDLGRHWGYDDRWSAVSFGMAGLIGHVCAGADPESGVVIAASFGGLASSGEECGELMGQLYDCAAARAGHAVP